MEFVTKQMHLVEYHELEKLIQDTFGFKEYQISSVEEVGNDSSLRFSIDGKLREFDEADLKAAMETKVVPAYRTRVFMNELCRRGIIPTGDWVVDVSW